MEKDKVKDEIEDPCKDYRNCKGCAHFDGPLCPRNFGSEAIQDPWLWVCVAVCGMIAVYLLSQ